MTTEGTVNSLLVNQIFAYKMAVPDLAIIKLLSINVDRLT